MNSGNWIELAALIVTILGGGGIGVSKLTRVAVAIEEFGKSLVTLGSAFATTDTTVQSHTALLAVHDAQLAAHTAQLAAHEVRLTPDAMAPKQP